MKNSLILLLLLLSGCASFQVSTLNHDPIYSIEGSIGITTIIDIAGVMDGVMVHIGIETKCGMIGYGAFHTEVV